MPPRGKSNGQKPEWYDPRHYSHLDPRLCEDPFRSWGIELDRCSAKWRAMEKMKSAPLGKQAPIEAVFKEGDSIREDVRRMPPALVIKHGKQPYRPDLPEDMYFGFHESRPPLRQGDDFATLDHPGFAMWFNMDATDELLRELFERVLAVARSKWWPSPIPTHGKGKENPKITTGLLSRWYERKIIPLCDLDYYFMFEAPEEKPTNVLLSRWLFGSDRSRPHVEISRSRNMLARAMQCRRVLYYTETLQRLAANQWWSTYKETRW